MSRLPRVLVTILSIAALFTQAGCHSAEHLRASLPLLLDWLLKGAQGSIL